MSDKRGISETRRSAEKQEKPEKAVRPAEKPLPGLQAPEEFVACAGGIGPQVQPLETQAQRPAPLPVHLQRASRDAARPDRGCEQFNHVPPESFGPVIRRCLDVLETLDREQTRASRTDERDDRLLSESQTVSEEREGSNTDPAGDDHSRREFMVETEALPEGADQVQAVAGTLRCKALCSGTDDRIEELDLFAVHPLDTERTP